MELSRYLNVNFDVERKTQLKGSYPVVVAISKEALNPDKTYDDINAFRADYSSSQANIFLAGNTFFGAGGNALRIVQRGGEETIEQVLARLDGDNWLVATCLDTIIDSEVVAVATYLDSLKAPDKKIFTTTTSNANAKSNLSEDDLSSKVKSKFVALQYATKNKYSDITIGAYLSQINLSGIKTINDYNFTPVGLGVEELTPTEEDTLEARNYNFTSKFKGKEPMNFGGNMADGTTINLRFGLICVENDITNVLADFIISKPIMNNASVAKISNLVSSVLARYVTNNLIAPGKIYTGDTDVEVYNGVEYTLIKNGQTLTSGYLVFVLPIESLTESDIAEHKAPPVFVYLAEARSIRKINVEGKVI